MRHRERIFLYGALTAMTAFAIDALLPVLPEVAADLPPTAPLATGQIITVFILGMAIGELIFGPLSDAAGRRKAVLAGLILFALGTVLASTAQSFQMVLAGRLLQGIGVAGPKIGTRAMIRDQYSGPKMAQILSGVFALLMLVPMIAPLLGAWIAALAGWRGVFWAYLVLAVALGAWLWRRHPETLGPNQRIPLQPRQLAHNSWRVLRRHDVTPVAMASGLIFGAQLVYFAVAAEVFGGLYGRETQMPFIFALLATGTGAALVVNAKLVLRTGMVPPILAGLGLVAASGAALLASAGLANGQPPITLLIALLWVGFFGLGLLSGNLNALAMRPLGDLAGLGASLIASVSSVMSFLFATAVEAAVAGPVWALATGFALAALFAGLLLRPALKHRGEG